MLSEYHTFESFVNSYKNIISYVINLDQLVFLTILLSLIIITNVIILMSHQRIP